MNAFSHEKGGLLELKGQMSCYWSWEYITTYNTLKGGLNLAAEFLNCSFESTYVKFMDKILKPGEHAYYMEETKLFARKENWKLKN